MKINGGVPSCSSLVEHLCGLYNTLGSVLSTRKLGTMTQTCNPSFRKQRQKYQKFNPLRKPCRWVNQGARCLQWGDSPEELPGGESWRGKRGSQGMLGSRHP